MNPSDQVQNWCTRHWAEIYEGIKAGTHNSILASKVLMQEALGDARFLAKVKAYAEPGKAPGQQEYDWAIKATAPQCCFLGAGFRAVVAWSAYAALPKEEADKWRELEQQVVKVTEAMAKKFVRKGQPGAA